MPEKEILLKLLESVRSRHLWNDLGEKAMGALSLSLALPILFKLIDLASPFRASTVAVFFLGWALATAALIMLLAGWARKRTGLAQAAAKLDRAAQLDDEIKTALWFVENTSGSEWIDAQIVRAAAATGRLDLDRFFPHLAPKRTITVAALVILLGALNFLPLRLNHNWFLLEAGPAFDAAPAVTALIDETRKRLENTARPDNPALVERLEHTLERLREGRISLDEAIQELDALRQDIQSGEVAPEALGRSVKEMAAQLGNSKLSDSVDAALAEQDLERAIQQIREAVEALRNARNQQEAARQLEALQQEGRSGALNPDSLRERLDNLAQQMDARNLPAGAANAMTSGNLQQAIDMMRQTATSASQGFANLSPEQLAQMAQQLDQLSQALQTAQNNAAAGQSLQNLASALARSQSASGPGENGQSGNNAPQAANGQQGAGPSSNSSSGQGTGAPGQQAGQGGGQEGQPGPGPSGSAAGLPAGDPGGIGSGGTSPGGLGGLFQGRPNKAPPGLPTSLAVHLEKEALVAEHADTPSANLLSASQQERSKLNYRDVPSALNPAQKDALDRQRTPWESRRHIRNYFESIHETR
ncbi:MAG TPA: hypothetical protein VFY29_12905 [Terriglobia bacterium]|nr:hypothetical protein [Terriglobia bacterium]